MKKIIALILVVVCMALLLTACGSKQLNIKEADYIILKNEKDNTLVEITDTQKVGKITDDFNSFSLKKGKSIQIPPGWSYQLVWYDTDDRILRVIGVVDDSTLGYNDHYYSVSDGRIDIDLFYELLKREPETLAGYISMEENKLYLDEVEVITAGDDDRIAQLDLKDGDMPNGYYIHNPSTETRSFELTDETEFTFTDYHLLFVEDPDSDRLYTTANKEKFIQHLKTSSDPPFTGEVPYPLFIEVEDNKVINITEKFIFTQ